MTWPTHYLLHIIATSFTENSSNTAEKGLKSGGHSFCKNEHENEKQIIPYINYIFEVHILSHEKLIYFHCHGDLREHEIAMG